MNETICDVLKGTIDDDETIKFDELVRRYEELDDEGNIEKQEEFFKKFNIKRNKLQKHCMKGVIYSTNSHIILYKINHKELDNKFASDKERVKVIKIFDDFEKRGLKWIIVGSHVNQLQKEAGKEGNSFLLLFIDQLYKELRENRKRNIQVANVKLNNLT